MRLLGWAMVVAILLLAVASVLNSIAIVALMDQVRP